MPRVVVVLILASLAEAAGAQEGDAQVTPTASTEPSPSTGTGREATACDWASIQPARPWGAAARDSVVAAVRQANACLGQGNADCTDAALAAVQGIALSDEERAVLAIPRATLANLRGDVNASDIYREALALPAVNEPLQLEIATRLAIALNAQGRFADALRVFGARFGCDDWTAEALAVRALAYETLGGRALALESYEAARRLYEIQGRAMPAALAERYRTLAETELPAPAAGTDRTLLTRNGNPSYPERAIKDGLEGWVQIEFDITDLGAVENVRVVASTNPIFEAATIAAAQRWRYAVKFEDGLPVGRTAEQSVLTFCLDRCRFRSNPPPQRDASGRYPTP
jgi:TonB family protein